jgi:hypothetical protein
VDEHLRNPIHRAFAEAGPGAYHFIRLVRAHAERLHQDTLGPPYSGRIVRRRGACPGSVESKHFLVPQNQLAAIPG